MASTDSNSFITKAVCGSQQGVINFYYKGDGCEAMPANPGDPLELLGDISLLRLDTAQRASLRAILRKEVERDGAEAVWNSRNFRKNVILSFGRII